MSIETLQGIAFPDPQAALDEALRVFVAALASLPPDQHRAMSIVAEAVKAAAVSLARRPLEITIAWPAGVPQHIRETLRAQMRAELQRAAMERAALEVDALLSTTPMISAALAAWIREALAPVSGARHRSRAAAPGRAC